MNEFLSINQIVTVSRNDALKHKVNGSLKAVSDHCTDDDENVHTIVSLYSQWAENESEAENAIWRMFEEEFPEYL